VPANLPGVLWEPNMDGNAVVEAADVALFAVEGSNESPVAIDLVSLSTYSFLVVPQAPLSASGSYRIEGTRYCEATDQLTEAAFQTGADAAVPTAGTALGTLTVGEAELGDLQVAASVSCNTLITASMVEVAITLGPELDPWADMLLFTTTVDGEVWRPNEGGAWSALAHHPPGASWTGRGTDLVYAMCDDQQAIGTIDEPGVGAGTHTVTMSAELPGQDVSYSTAEASFSLDCSTAAGGSGGAGGGSSTGGGPDQSSSGGTETESGCSCRHGPADPTRAGGLLALLVGMAAWRRRR